MINFELQVVQVVLRASSRKVHPAERRNSHVYNADEALWVQLLKRRQPTEGLQKGASNHDGHLIHEREGSPNKLNGKADFDRKP